MIRQDVKGGTNKCLLVSEGLLTCRTPCRRAKLAVLPAGGAAYTGDSAQVDLSALLLLLLGADAVKQRATCCLRGERSASVLLVSHSQKVRHVESFC